MSTEEKVELVSSVWEDNGLALALEVVELPRSTWYYHRNQKISYEEKYTHIKPLLEKIALQHPSYGIVRIDKELRENYNKIVNHKVIQRLLQSWDLALPRAVKKPKPGRMKQVIDAAEEQANLVAQMDQIELFEVAYTDFTEIPYANGTRKAYLMPIIGHKCKMVYGWAVAKSANTSLALKAWEMTMTTFKKHDIPYTGMIIHHDQDSVYTGYRWGDQLLLKDKVRLSYALHGAKDNPEMESFNGHFKGEGHSLFLDAQNLFQLFDVIKIRMAYYNEERRHSSIGLVAPLTYIEQVHIKKEAI